MKLPAAPHRNRHLRQAARYQIEIRRSRPTTIGQAKANKVYRKYLKLENDSVRITQDKIEWESGFDCKWVLITNTNFFCNSLRSA